MAHWFVLAKFSPTFMATKARMEPTVVQAASLIVCRPFLALAVALAETHAGQQFGYNVVLFPLSPNKPTGDFAEYYATISLPTTKQTDFLSLSLPSQPPQNLLDVLYLHTAPALYLISGPPSCALPYQLDLKSLQQLRTLSEDHQNSWFRAAFQRLNSGGEESVQQEWDAWSGEDLYQVSVPFGSLTVEYLNPDGINLGTIAPPYVLEELMIFKKLALDYSRKRVDNLTTWCLESRKYFSTSELNSCCARHPDLDGEIKEQAVTLYRMRIPVDRQPISDDTIVDESESEEGDDPICHLAPPDPPVPFSNVRIVLFDSIGSIFDRQMSVLRALRLLDPQEVGKHEPENILKVYFEVESLLLHDNPEWDLYRVVEGALKDTLHHLGALNRYDPILLNGACEDVLRLGLYPDVEKTIEALCSQGITVVGLDVPGALSFHLPSLPPSFIFDSFSQDTSALFKTSSDLFSTLFERLRFIRDDLEGKEQVLVVTTGRFRVLESAHLAGYPTALIEHNLESKVNLYPTCSPTLVVPGGLSGLHEKLATFPGICTNEDCGNGMFAVRAGLYQGAELLGSGSFGEVYDGVHVLTGAPVAIKHDSPGHSIKSHVCETSQYPCSLPYEAQVYKVLSGKTGFPSLRWYGVREGAHVLVLDKLGPDLDAVRRLCRGRLSLKTVLMLGLQMLERVESVHSRGLILRDLKPQNFVMGLAERSSIVHLLDFGLVRPYMNPITNEHIPFVENLQRVGTARYTSYNMLLKRETSRRDDIEALGNVLLFLLRSRLPWQGIYAPGIEAKYVRLAEMRVGKAMQDFVDESPGRDLWHAWFTHCRELAFVDKPDYDFLKDIMTRQILKEDGGADGRFDWLDGTMLEYGTLVPGEYKFDSGLFYDDFSMKDLIPGICR